MSTRHGVAVAAAPALGLAVALAAGAEERLSYDRGLDPGWAR